MTLSDTVGFPRCPDGIVCYVSMFAYEGYGS